MREPSPILKEKSFQIYLGDSISIMNAMKPESVDMIFADPPYNLSNGGTSVHSGKRVSVKIGRAHV